MSKVLKKIHLISLVCLSFINFLAFIVNVNLKDHVYYISSTSSELNTGSYFINSILGVSQYYLGLIIIPFTCLFFFLYLRILKAQSFIKNILVSIALFSVSLFLFYMIFPSSLGNGLNFHYSAFPWYLKTLSILGSVSIFIFAVSDWSLARVKERFRKLQAMIEKSLVSFKSRFDIFELETIPVVSPSHASFDQDDDETEETLEYEFEDEVEADPQDETRISEVVEDKKEVSTPVKTLKKRLVRKKKSNSSYHTPETLIKSLVSEDRKIILGPDQAYFEGIITKLEDKLNEFKIDSKVINVIKGPVVDTFEVELGPGIKVSRVTGVTEDLSLALSGAPIRMIYPLKGRTTMGIEVPRNPREIIYLDDVLKTSAFKKADKRLPVAMGKNAFGETTVVDLAAMPHMLVAGATGAGKSVYINTLLVSLLVKLSPEKMKLILIDPKQLELALYSQLPHLLMPVMTDPKSSSIALLWACQEMERRYSILKEMGVRNVEGFNKKLETSTREDLLKIKDLYKEGEDYKLPYIVIIVDEFADLILSKCGKDIEINICRLAAKARASGIHLVLATQRPSVDVITGLIKSNFPTRVSFRVTSPVDSRTILNSMGAEKLLGKGDMLYKHGVEMHRLHSSYVDESEIEKLVESMCEGEPTYSKSALEFMEEIESGATLDDIEGVSIQQTFKLEGKDEYYQQAVDIVRELKACSTSMLQRKLKIGFNRAANLVDQLEADGIIGPSQGSKPRKVFI